MGIKVLLADDEEGVRRAIRTLLAQHPEIELVGEATEKPARLLILSKIHFRLS